MATAGAIIDEARDYHPSFSPNNFPGPILLRRLGRAELSLYTMISGLEPEMLAELATVDREAIELALEGKSPAPLPPYITVVSARVWDQDGEGSRPLKLLETSQTRSRGTLFPSATPVAGGLLLTDLRDLGYRDSGWETAGRIEARIVPVPRPLRALTDELTSPDMLTAGLVGELVSFMAVRGGIESSGLVSMAERERDALVGLASTWGQGRTWQVERSY